MTDLHDQKRFLFHRLEELSKYVINELNEVFVRLALWQSLLFR